MFQRILDQSSISAEEAPVFRYYLERHTELDGDHHAPMALRLLVKMCEGDEMRENEVLQQAKSSIGQRIELSGWGNGCSVIDKTALWLASLCELNLDCKFVSRCWSYHPHSFIFRRIWWGHPWL